MRGRTGITKRIKRAVMKMDTMQIYCLIGFLCIVGLLACFLCSRGDLIAHYFFRDTLDTGMDFFHSIEYVRGRTPYTVFNTLYPPLANLVFFALYLMVPQSVAEKWPYDFGASIEMRGTNMDLRVYQAPLLIFTVFFIVSAIMIFALVDYALQKRNKNISKWAALCMTLSYGCLCAVERGNIVILVAGCGLVFFLFHNSENRFLKELALISLAFAAGLKLYPAVWGALLLAEKDWKAAVRAVLYGIAALVLPMFAFEGLSAFSIFFNATASFGSASAGDWIGTGASEILQHLLGTINGTLSIDGTMVSIFALAICALLVISCFVQPKKWQKCLALTLCMLLFKSQGAYSLCMFVVPLTLFLMEEKNVRMNNLIPFFCLILLTVNIPAFSQYGVYDHRNAITQVGLLIAALWCVFSAMWEMINKFKRAKQETNLE